MAQVRDRSPRHSANSADTSAAPPAPRFALGWAALVYALSTLTLGYPALTGRFLVNPHSDQYIAGYAFREFGASTLRATGHFPLWNPYLFGGMPYIAAMHGDIFYPTFLLRILRGAHWRPGLHDERPDCIVGLPRPRRQAVCERPFPARIVDALSRNP